MRRPVACRIPCAPRSSTARTGRSSARPWGDLDDNSLYGSLRLARKAAWTRTLLPRTSTLLILLS
eukprot:5650148-Pyramimonas_sp.AAC.1